MAAGVLALAGCQRDELASIEYPLSDGVIRFAPGIAAVSSDNGQIKSAASVDEATEACVLTSEDGSLTLPMTCETIEGINHGSASSQTSEDVAGTKATLINDPGTDPGTVLPLENFASSIDSTFWVAAWDNAATPSQIIPDAAAKAFTGGYVAGSAEKGFYQKVKYRAKDVARNKLTTPYWMTMQPQISGYTGDADDEYIWKKITGTSNVETKTFYAYANVPSGVTMALLAGGAGQTMTCTAAPTQDILMGYYSGEGKTGTGDAAKHTGTASIKFHHPFSAVKFKTGTLASGLTVSSVSIENVYGFVAGKGGFMVKQVADAFTWTMSDGEAFKDENLTSIDFTCDGDAVLVIPQAIPSGAMIKVTMSDGTVLYHQLTGTWSVGCLYVYTIGYDKYGYTFELVKSEDATQTFTNTTADSSTKNIGITSKKKDVTGETAEDWRIRSYRIGSEAPVDVRATSFTGGGLSVSKSGDKLQITALKRTSSYGGHDYWVNSMKRTERLDWSPAAWSGVTDLSNLDFKTEGRNAHAMTTANCYVIRHAGTYKLPLVYGNAVQGGFEYADAYAPTMSEGEPGNFLSPFQNHLGNGITSAFIENNTNCIAASADIIWQDNAEVITEDVKIVSGASAATPGSYNTSNVRYLQFTVDETAVCQNNAIIAVKDGSGNIMWSWHIWTTNDPALLSDPIAVTNLTGVEYDFFPIYTLGWIDANYLEREMVTITLEQTYSGETATVTVLQPLVPTAGRGCWYQFGRKDPMCTVDSPNQGTFTPNGGNNGGAGVSLATAICNPNVFYTVINGSGPDANYDWCDNTYYNLWTGKKSTVGQFDQNADIIKSVYDPSPVGYKLPASNAFTGFTTTNVDGVFDKGWNFFTKPDKEGATVFFPVAGCRSYINGTVINDSFSGNYWSAVPNSLTYGYHLYFTSGSVTPLHGSPRTNGFLVRPVQEPRTMDANTQDYNGRSL